VAGEKWKGKDKNEGGLKYRRMKRGGKIGGKDRGKDREIKRAGKAKEGRVRVRSKRWEVRKSRGNE
jgi:hypothetical protein